MSTLILHIGSQKTGTTAIQGFMAANREKLSEAGVAVPLLTRQCNRQELHTGAFFEYAVKQAAYDSIGASFPSPAEQRALARSFGKLIRQPMLAVHDRWENSERLRRAASEYSSVLLSDEVIYDDMLHPDGLQAGARLFWGSVPQVLGELGFDRIKAIVYLRRQDLYLGSYWKQFVKTFDEDLALEDSYRSSSGYWNSNMDYAGKVAAIEEGLGAVARSWSAVTGTAVSRMAISSTISAMRRAFPGMTLSASRRGKPIPPFPTTCARRCGLSHRCSSAMGKGAMPKTSRWSAPCGTRPLS